MTIELEVLAAAGTGATGSVMVRISEPDADPTDIYMEVGDTMLFSEPEGVDVVAAPADELESAVAGDAKMLSELRRAAAEFIDEVERRATVEEAARLAVEKTSHSFMWKVPEVQAVHVQHENIGASYDFLRANKVAVRLAEPRDITHSGIILKGWVSRFDLEISIGSWVVVTPGARPLIFSDEEFWATFVGFGRAS